MRVALLVNMTRPNAYNVACDVIGELKRLKVKVYIQRELSEFFSDCGCEFGNSEDCIRNCDAVISVGGDGTIIHTAQIAVEYDKPLLGINAGRLGFLAGLEKSELGLLCKLVTEDYRVDKRMRLSVKHYEGEELINEYTCLNDVVIGRGASLHLCDIDVSESNRQIYNYLSDGLIVATPTGSTAYSLSSGGPVVDTDIESLILTPVCNHSLFSRSIIFKPDTKLEFKVNNSEVCSALFSCDGEDEIPMTGSTRLVVTKSDKYSKIIRIKSDNFYEVLNNKMVERSQFNKE